MMGRIRLIMCLSLIASCVALVAAGRRDADHAKQVNSHTAPPPSPIRETDPNASSTELYVESSKAAADTRVQAAAPLFNLDWWSVNSGGAIEVTGTNYGLGLSVGQVAAGHVSGTNYNLGVGFWYGAAAGGGCPMTIFGDVDLGGTVTSGDIIYLVNFVFKGGPLPQPCEAAGDVDCGGSVTSGDIIYLVNFVFKGGPPPCNTCTSPLAGAC